MFATHISAFGGKADISRPSRHLPRMALDVAQGLRIIDVTFLSGQPVHPAASSTVGTIWGEAMDQDHRERNVMVWGEPHIVTVYRKSETVYEAIGNYMCETICVNDQSEGAAIKRWREVAAGVSPSEQLTRGAG